jgi:hypothetical protein
MTGINMGRVVLGGLLAGLVINVSEFVLNAVVLADDMEAALARMNLAPVGGSAVGVFMVLAFALGIAMVWLYAAIRPRYGAGVRTALCAGATVWFFSYLYPSIGYAVMGMFSAGSIGLAVIWGLVELLVAAVAGAWLYQEEGGGRGVHV